MILSVLPLSALLLPFGYAATLSVRQTGLHLPLDDRNQPPNLTYERINVASPGQSPVYYTLACNTYYGAGLEARSCFDALSYAPVGSQQETWAADGAVPPGVHGAVRLPVVSLDGESSLTFPC